MEKPNERQLESTIHISLKPTMAGMMRELAEKKGYSQTMLVRFLITQEYERMKQAQLLERPAKRVTEEYRL